MTVLVVSLCLLVGRVLWTPHRVSCTIAWMALLADIGPDMGSTTPGVPRWFLVCGNLECVYGSWFPQSHHSTFRDLYFSSFADWNWCIVSFAVGRQKCNSWNAVRWRGRTAQGALVSRLRWCRITSRGRWKNELTMVSSFVNNTNCEHTFILQCFSSQIGSISEDFCNCWENSNIVTVIWQ